MRFKVLAVVVLALMVRPLAVAENNHDVVPDDYFTLATITEIAVAPDGKHVAYCQGTWDKADDSRRTDVWIVATDGSSPPRRLTFDRANDRRLRWSADGGALYFLGSRRRASETKPPYDGTKQVWTIRVMPVKPGSNDLEGRELQAVTRVEGGVADYDHAPLAGTLFYTHDTTSADEDDFARLRAAHKADYGHGNRKITEVHQLDLTTWRTEKLIDAKRYIREFAVTRDGKRIAMISAFDDSVVKSEGESRVDVWEAGKITTPPTDVYRAKAASPHAWLEELAWSPDGQRFAFCAIFDAYPTEVVIGSKGAGGWGMTLMKRVEGGPGSNRRGDDGPSGRLHVRGYGSPLLWVSNDSVAYLAEWLGEVHPRTYVLSDEASHVPPTTRAEVTYATDLNAAGSALKRVELTAEVGGMPVLRANAEGVAWRELVDPNPHIAGWKSPAVKHITWKAPDGAEVGGVLELPHGYRKGDRLPLVVAIHGGPTMASDADLRFDPHNGRLYFAAAGYAVLCPNYRGSTGYGDKFVTDLIGRENDIEVKDILAGIQHLIDEGIADPQRVGVTGWSNGGYLTNCLITLKDPPVKFKAASSGGCILDTVAEWGFNDEPAFPKVFKKGLPWETPDIYRRTSPTYGLGNVTTPTLIHVGGSDERCPPGHSRMLYRALKEYRHVPTELVIYPGEPHGLTKMSHLRAKMEWDLAWFDKYLKKAKP